MSRAVFIEGIGFWAPALHDWNQTRAALRGEPGLAPAADGANPAPRPQPQGLGANERRRAPDAVLMALQVAEAAVAMAGQDAARVASVFTSTHGDLPTVDGLCKTLAGNPLLLSPTRFHHSVHNVASGYWAMATGNHLPSTAVSHFGHAFAAGFLEAASQCVTEDLPVLLVGYDTPACGTLAAFNRSQGSLAVALLLSPVRTERSRWWVDWALGPAQATGALAAPVLRPAALDLAGNAMADALPLCQLLADERPTRIVWPLEAAQALHLSLEPLQASHPMAAQASSR